MIFKWEKKECVLERIYVSSSQASKTTARMHSCAHTLVARKYGENNQ